MNSVTIHWWNTSKLTVRYTWFDNNCDAWQRPNPREIRRNTTLVVKKGVVVWGKGGCHAYYAHVTQPLTGHAVNPNKHHAIIRSESAFPVGNPSLFKVGCRVFRTEASWSYYWKVQLVSIFRTFTYRGKGVGHFYPAWEKLQHYDHSRGLKCEFSVSLSLGYS